MCYFVHNRIICTHCGLFAQIGWFPSTYVEEEGVQWRRPCGWTLHPLPDFCNSLHNVRDFSYKDPLWPFAQATELSAPLLLPDGLPCWYYMYIRFIILMYGSGTGRGTVRGMLALPLLTKKLKWISFWLPSLPLDFGQGWACFLLPSTQTENCPRKSMICQSYQRWSSDDPTTVKCFRDHQGLLLVLTHTN